MFLGILMTLMTTLGWSFTCSSPGNPELGQLVTAAAQGINCPQAARHPQVHLTFDDGPSSATTPLLLDTLRSRNVKATFFVTASRLQGTATEARAMVRRELSEGHLVASHGLDHEPYEVQLSSTGAVIDPGMSSEDRLDQIRTSTQLLDQATNGAYSRQSLHWYRFPYGRGALPSEAELNLLERRGMNFSSTDRSVRLAEYRRLSEPLHELAEEGYSHLLWNLDSGDSGAFAHPSTQDDLKNYILSNLRQMCDQNNPRPMVALFHDIKPFNATAVPVLIDIAKCMGVEFVDARAVSRSESLRQRGTLITPVSVRASVADPIADLLRNIEVAANCDPNQRPGDNWCWSETGKWYNDCDYGEESICIRGGWHRKTEEWIRQCQSRGLIPPDVN